MNQNEIVLVVHFWDTSGKPSKLECKLFSLEKQKDRQTERQTVMWTLVSMISNIKKLTYVHLYTSSSIGARSFFEKLPFLVIQRPP